MFVTTNFRNQNYRSDLRQPIKINLPLNEGEKNANCFWSPMPEWSPVRAGDFVGDTRLGGAVNFFDVKFNPHGNGTHTECVGHIATERFYINQTFDRYFFVAKLISVFPEKMENGDRIIQKKHFEVEDLGDGIEALIIRTYPNDDLKKTTNYSGSNPPYIAADALSYLVENGIEHLLIDLPSVDREEDGGLLLGHRAFWQFPENIRTKSTITELVYIENSVPDGVYLLQFSIAPFSLDVSPSTIILYSFELIKEEK